MLDLKIWIDADSCPATLRNFLTDEAKRCDFTAVLVANRAITEESGNTKMLVCDKKKDEADNIILERAAKNDIVVTRDLLFAKRLVDKGITVFNDRGTKFSRDNIEDRIMERNLSMNLSAIGLGGNKKNMYGQNELKKFTEEFKAELQKHIVAEIFSRKRLQEGI